MLLHESPGICLLASTQTFPSLRASALYTLYLLRHQGSLVTLYAHTFLSALLRGHVYSQISLHQKELKGRKLLYLFGEDK